MKNNVVVFDLDGTLLDSRNEIIGGDKTLQCLERLQQMGCTLAICTGRLDHDIVKINEKYQLHIEHHISQNGAVIIKEGFLESILLDKQESLSIYEYIKKQQIRIELNTISNRYWISERDPDFPKELYDSHIIIQDFQDILLYQPAVLFLLIGEQYLLTSIATYINSQFQKTKAVMTSATSLEIMHKHASKGYAVKMLYPHYDIYTIGDSPNDFDMFPVSKQGYLVSNQKCSIDCVRKENIIEALQDIIKRLEDGKDEQ